MARIIDLHDENSAYPFDLSALGIDIFESLSRHFPVCMASDEFHYFPQYKSNQHDWLQWDDFSPDGVSGVLTKLSDWTRKLSGFSNEPVLAKDKIDIFLLNRVLSTLREQLEEVRFHRNQPSFYLTIIGIGLAEALSDGPEAFEKRIRTLSDFVEQAIRNLEHIPRLFRDLGYVMSQKIAVWLDSLNPDVAPLMPAITSLRKLAAYLKNTPTIPDFLLPLDLYAHIAETHMGSGMGLDDIIGNLDQEIHETRAILVREALRIDPCRHWQIVLKELPEVLAEKGCEICYQSAIEELREHCVKQGFVTRGFVDHLPVTVQIIPDYLKPVRSNAAFSMPPGYPAQGGVFYFLPDVKMRMPRDYRLLTAHETFPGHQLLDAHRWNLTHPLRRPIEFPIFYEGWASFSEEILFETLFFRGPVDRLLMANRRFWRAHRARTDLEIHTGRRSLQEAAAVLVENGLRPDRALAMVQRYTLKPGYQLAYTLGSRRFHGLYKMFRGRGRSLAEFVQSVLAQGEIGFDHLADVLSTQSKTQALSTGNDR